MSSWLRREAELASAQLKPKRVGTVLTATQQESYDVLEQFGLLVLAEVEQRLEEKDKADHYRIANLRDALALVHSLREEV